MLPESSVSIMEQGYLITKKFPLVYLCGPIKHATWAGATTWRERATRYLADFGIFTLDPMRGKDFLESKIEGTFGESFDDEKQSYKDLDDGWVTEHGITYRDKWDVQRCGILLANFEGADKVSIGSMLEFGWADAGGAYILTVMDNNNPHWHGMVRELSGLIAPTLDEALERIPVLLGATR